MLEKHTKKSLKNYPIMKPLKTNVGKTYKKVLKNYPIMKTLKNSCWKNIHICLKKK